MLIPPRKLLWPASGRWSNNTILFTWHTRQPLPPFPCFIKQIAMTPQMPHLMRRTTRRDHAVAWTVILGFWHTHETTICWMCLLQMAPGWEQNRRQLAPQRVQCKNNCNGRQAVHLSTHDRSNKYDAFCTKYTTVYSQESERHVRRWRRRQTKGVQTDSNIIIYTMSLGRSENARTTPISSFACQLTVEAA